jgi:signal peptidase I
MARGSPPGDDDDWFDERSPARDPDRRKDPGRESGPYRRARPTAPRRWDADEEYSEEWDRQGRWAKGRGTRTKPPVYWRARDSLWFEPLVALAIIVLLLVAFWAYTQNWPPAYVVESNSMQHGSGDVVGLINAGDIVLAQKVSFGSIVPYVIGMQTHYSTYGEWGDVLLYHPNGNPSATPVIHRAILYLDYDPLSGTYNATDLAGLPCGSEPGAVWATPGTSNECGYRDLGPVDELQLFHVGWRSVNLTIQMGSVALGAHSGFVTMGDNNTGFDQAGTSTPDISSLVEPGWIIGVARGMIPWFGSVKLLLDGNAGRVPAASWEFMGLTIAAVLLLAFGLHWSLRPGGPLRRFRAGEGEAGGRPEDDEEVERPPGPARRFLRALRPWGSDEYDPNEEEPPPRSGPPPRTRYVDRAPPRHGRPRPAVRPRSRPRRDGDDERDR